MPLHTTPGSAGATELNTDSAERERYGLSVAQVVTDPVTCPNSGLFDTIGFDDVEVVVVLYSTSGSPTSATITAMESTTNTAAGQAAVAGAQVAFTGADLAAGTGRAFRVRWVGRQRYLGIKCEMAGTGSVGVALLARGIGARETSLAAAPSTVVAGVTLA